MSREIVELKSRPTSRESKATLSMPPDIIVRPYNLETLQKAVLKGSNMKDLGIQCKLEEPARSMVRCKS